MSHFTVAGLQLNLKDKQNLDQFTDKVRAIKRRFPFVQMIVGSELSICGAGINYAGPMLDEVETVSYTHLRAHETDSYLVCRLLLE